MGYKQRYIYFTALGGVDRMMGVGKYDIETQNVCLLRIAF